MIGTDWPVCTVAASYQTVVGLVLEAIAEYSETERLRILEGTARSVYAKSVYETHA